MTLAILNRLAKKITVTSWGNTQKSPCVVFRPERHQELVEIMHQVDERGIIAYGNGLNYGDAAFNSHGQILTTARLNRLIAFDQYSGELVCEAGVTFAELLHTFLPRGWAPAAVPGSLYVTIGGAVANDVHGKDHRRYGSFGQRIIWLELVTPHGVLQLSKDQHHELLRATIGGLGLTGIISKICFKLVPAASMLRVRQQRKHTLEELLESLIATAATACYCVAWLDLSDLEHRQCRGILTSASSAADVTATMVKHPYGVVPRLPISLVNHTSSRCFNQLYYQRIPPYGRQEYTHLIDFINPLDRFKSWNRLYGRRGLLQLQCLLPYAAALHGLTDLITVFRRNAAVASLVVLKALWQQGDGLLAFAAPGITLAVDLPYHARHVTVLQESIAVVLHHGGKVYLAKDTLLQPQQFQQMYPEYNLFNQLREQYNLMNTFQSDMSRRLGLNVA